MKTTKKKPATKKRNPQDATLRNINALKRRVLALEMQMIEIYNSCGLDIDYAIIKKGRIK